MVDELVDECDENIDDEVKIVSESKNKYSSCILYIVQFSIFFTINVGIAVYFIYYKLWIVIRKLLLNMVMSIKQQFNYNKNKLNYKLIKWE